MVQATTKNQYEYSSTTRILVAATNIIENMLYTLVCAHNLAENTNQKQIMYMVTYGH